MSAVSPHDKRLHEVLKRLGLPTAKVRRIIINIEVNEAVTATVEFYPDITDVQQAEGLTKHFKFVEEETG